MSRSRRRFVLGAYLLLLAASLTVRVRLGDASEPGPDQRVVQLAARRGADLLAQRVSLAYRDKVPRLASPPPAVVLVHGSPGSGDDFHAVLPLLGERARVIVPDLPGFGRSSRTLPDYSFRAHGAYLLDLLDSLDIRSAHVVGFSMGGGVALSMVDIAPSRVASITLLSAIGVQEMELLGEYHINRAVHLAQLVGLWLVREAVPHFGALDRTMLSVPYARNFYDSDQRPLRRILLQATMPTLIVHGRGDGLVPYEAALEHHRLVPQSELQARDGSHFLVFTHGPAIARLVGEFVDRVERGDAPPRARAAPSRVADAQAPFDPQHLPRFRGIAALTTSSLLAVGTLVSEDLASIAAGLLVAQDRLGFAVAVAACFVGILAGDLLLFGAGRILGRRVLRLPGMSRLVRPERLARSSAWLERRGPIVVFASRFMPGTRLPTCLAAGLLDTSALRFALWFALACALWTPLLVGGAALAGDPWLAAGRPEDLLWRAGLTMLAVAILVRLLTALATHRGRRLFVSRWRRLTRWEFWPPWIFYPPLLLWIAMLMLRYRSVTAFTATNPAIPAGGFVGESKFAILRGLADGGPLVASAILLRASEPFETRVATLGGFMRAHRFTYPIVLKPDQGQRGAGVAIVGDAQTAAAYLQRARGDVIVQEYVPGQEFGVFYVRQPSAPRGRIISITEKRLVGVTGDGRRTLEQLILDDPRAVCMAEFFLRRHASRLDDVPAAGEHRLLVEVGTHCRGALFLDAADVHTPELESAIDALARTFTGFDFGRFDIRVPDRATFRRGERFKVVELNGVTSEATHIYDPRHGLLHAYRVLAEQWRLAFEIGAANRANGVKPVGVVDLLRRVREYGRVAEGHVDLQEARAS